MPANKVEYFGKVLIDLTEDTVNPETLAEGVTAHNSAGERITGTMKSENLNAVIEEQAALIEELSTVLDGKASGGGPAEVSLQEKSVTPTTSSQTVTPDSGYDGLSKVTVNAIPSNYEDVTTETSAYTTKLASLETAISALETELQGKASGGGSVETCTVDIQIAPDNDNGIVSIYYMDTSGQWIKYTNTAWEPIDITINIPKGFIYFTQFFCASSWQYVEESVSGNAEWAENMTGYLLAVTGDCNVVF